MVLGRIEEQGFVGFRVASEAQADLLGLNTSLCFVLGVALLRNRDRVRRLYARGRLSSGWRPRAFFRLEKSLEKSESAPD